MAVTPRFGVGLIARLGFSINIKPGFESQADWSPEISVEMRYKVYNGSELIFTAVADLPEVAGPDDLKEFRRLAHEHFRNQYPAVDLADPRIREEWEQERVGS